MTRAAGLRWRFPDNPGGLSSAVTVLAWTGTLFLKSEGRVQS